MPFLQQWATTQPDKVAFCMAESGESLSYAEIDAHADAVARWMISLGLQPGQTIALLLENCMTTFELWWGARRAGLYYTPISIHLTSSEAEYVLRDCGASMLVTSSALQQLAREILKSLPDLQCFIVDEVLEPFVSYQREIAQFMPGGDLPQRPMGREFMYSSGTTGFPKGIRRPMASYADRFALPPLELKLREVFRFDQDTVFLCSSPLYHATGRFNIRTVECGGTAVVMKRFEPEGALAAIERYRVSHSHWVPTMFIRMLALPQEVRMRYDVSTMRCAIHAAAPCPADVKDAMIRWWGPCSDEYYGGSENLGVTHIASKDWLAHRGSVGKPIWGELHILEEDGRESPPGSIGLIYFGGGVAFQYHNDLDKTKSVFNDRGWGTYGDLGYVDAEGYLYLSDRRTDLIISGGVNIYPQEIENVLAEHPQVEAAAVIGIAHSEFGEEVKAIVQPKRIDLAGEALGKELLEYCQTRLSKIKCPRTVSFEEKLPISETGKLLRRVLKERYRR